MRDTSKTGISHSFLPKNVLFRAISHSILPYLSLFSGHLSFHIAPISHKIPVTAHKSAVYVSRYSANCLALLVDGCGVKPYSV